MNDIKNVTITYEYNNKYNPEGYLEALIVSIDVFKSFIFQDNKEIFQQNTYCNNQEDTFILG